MGYLYGASIQGIQGYIFETNKLKEIVGASDLIESFSSESYIRSTVDQLVKKEYELLRNAAGNIRISFDELEDVKKFVLIFQKNIMKQAYGITISQAVVEYSDDYSDQMKNLEQKLKEARSKRPLDLDAKFALMKQAARTGKPATNTHKYIEKEFFDKGNHQKFDRAKDGQENLLLKKLGIAKEYHDKFTLEMEQISNNGKNKIAVIHADGNGLGLLLQAMSEENKEKTAKEIKKTFADFSTNLESATVEAIKESFHKYFSINHTLIKFRPIIIGGDDVAIICDADKALEFTQMYLERFEAYTYKKLGKSLTACAGIVYSNEKFPFHYAIKLAEELCSEAKEVSMRSSSCLMFHNIEDSYVLGYEEIKANQQIIQVEEDKTIKLSYAPYYISKEPSIKTLLTISHLVNQDNFPLRKLREWVKILYTNESYASEYLEEVVDTVAKSDFDMAKLNNELSKINENFRLNNLLIEDIVPGVSSTLIDDLLQLKGIKGEYQ